MERRRYDPVRDAAQDHVRGSYRPSSASGYGALASSNRGNQSRDDAQPRLSVQSSYDGLSSQNSYQYQGYAPHNPSASRTRLDPTLFAPAPRTLGAKQGKKNPPPPIPPTQQPRIHVPRQDDQSSCIQLEPKSFSTVRETQAAQEGQTNPLPQSELPRGFVPERDPLTGRTRLDPTSFPPVPKTKSAQQGKKNPPPQVGPPRGPVPPKRTKQRKPYPPLQSALPRAPALGSNYSASRTMLDPADFPSEREIRAEKERMQDPKRGKQKTSTPPSGTKPAKKVKSTQAGSSSSTAKLASSPVRDWRCCGCREKNDGKRKDCEICKHPMCGKCGKL
jgi:hypothetical protein